MSAAVLAKREEDEARSAVALRNGLARGIQRIRQEDVCSVFPCETKLTGSISHRCPPSDQERHAVSTGVCGPAQSTAHRIDGDGMYEGKTAVALDLAGSPVRLILLSSIFDALWQLTQCLSKMG